MLRLKIQSKYYATRSNYWRLKRLLFPSPAELRFINIMGGKFITIPFIKGGDQRYPFVIVISLGKLLKSENYSREVRVGKFYIDFANDIGRGIEIDGRQYHLDVVYEFERDSYIYQRGWRLMRIPAGSLWREPDKVQRDVMLFLTR